MHHTDYGRNLRLTKHRAAKLPATNARSGNSTQNNRTNPLFAAIAAILVIVVIFQMDPANAEPTMDVPGYGALQFNHNTRAIRAKTMTSELDMVIEEGHLTMYIDQTFINQTTQSQPGVYQLALPANAKTHLWSVQLEACNIHPKANIPNCHATHKPESQKMMSTAIQIANQFHIQTPELAPNQRLKVYVEIKYPIAVSQQPIAATVPINDETPWRTLVSYTPVDELRIFNRPYQTRR